MKTYRKKDCIRQTVREILDNNIPRTIEQLGTTEQDIRIKEELNFIYEKLIKATYHETEFKTLTKLRREPWFRICLEHYDGNPGAMNFLMGLDKHPFKKGSSEQIISMLITFGLKGSDLWVFYKDCCECDYNTIEKVWDNWLHNRITTNQILSHMTENHGKRIEIENITRSDAKATTLQ